MQWAVAFDRYALACAVIPIDGVNGPPVWTYTSAMAHRSVVFEARVCVCVCVCVCVFAFCVILQVAANAENGSPARRPWLGMIYDRLARKQFSERMNANEVSRVM